MVAAGFGGDKKLFLKFFINVFFLFGLGFPSLGIAQAQDASNIVRPPLMLGGEECSSLTAENLPRITHTRRGLPLNKTMKIRLEGEIFEIPIGYLYPWPTEDTLEKEIYDSKTESIKFRFWMPDLRYPERDSWKVAFFHFCEPGRKRPAKNEYVIKTYINFPFTEPFEGYATPKKQFQNITAPPYEDKYLFDQKYGLLHYRLKQQKYGGDGYFYEDHNFQVNFDCTPGYVNLPNPLCKSDVYFSKEKLGFFIMFSVRDLPKWRENVMAAHTLIHQWHVE
jgi:hypothetical protein